MDILISSNLERLLYHMTNDTAKVSGWMSELAESGRYDVGQELLQEIQETFWADWANDKQTENTINRVYEAKGYVPDTHTAVAWSVAESYQKQTGDSRPMVIVSTASPYKFNESVLDALGAEQQGLDEFGLLDRLAEYNPDKVPQGLAALRTADILHRGVCTKEAMRLAVADFSKK